MVSLMLGGLLAISLLNKPIIVHLTRSKTRCCSRRFAALSDMAQDLIELSFRAIRAIRAIQKLT